MQMSKKKIVGYQLPKDKIWIIIKLMKSTCTRMYTYVYRMFKAESFVKADELCPFQRNRLSKYGLSKQHNTVGKNSEVALRGLQ